MVGVTEKRPIQFSINAIIFRETLLFLRLRLESDLSPRTTSFLFQFNADEDYLFSGVDFFGFNDVFTASNLQLFHKFGANIEKLEIRSNNSRIKIYFNFPTCNIKSLLISNCVVYFMIDSPFRSFEVNPFARLESVNLVNAHVLGQFAGFLNKHKSVLHPEIFHLSLFN